MGRGKKRRGRPPLSFKLELEVLGIEVVDANIAVLTTTAVTVWGKRDEKVISPVTSPLRPALYQQEMESALTTPSKS